MDAYLAKETELDWHLCLYDNQIIGGLGVIDNDFHERKDLAPNICAVYTEENHRGHKIAENLLLKVVNDLKSKGFSPVYLVTNHIGFYEKYGWEFYGEVKCDDEDYLSRMYIHR